jgi:hypothetical protein
LAQPRREEPALVPSPYEERVVPFTAGDGLALNLINVRDAARCDRGPVLLVHGAGVRANLFRAPVETNLVDVLVASGYDVWLENWRASIDLPPNPWTLDQAAAYDHPAAVQTIVNQTGQQTLKAIIHCQGSTSFMMSAVAGLVPQVEMIISNAVSLHPVVPAWSAAKLRFAVPLVRRLKPYFDPQWGDHSPDLSAWLLTALVRLSHHECDNTVCKMVSFTYGSGFPALWRHENLNAETHDWIRREFGPVPLTFFQQMARCVAGGRLVACEPRPGLPDDYTAEPPKTSARFAFLTGEKNRCFLPESQVRSHAYFSRLDRKDHSLHRLRNYSHLDVFIGKSAAKDVFPLILRELEQPAR